MFLDAAITAVPNENKQKYIEKSKKIAKLFKEKGALQYIECWGADVPEGKNTSMLKAVKCEENETVALSWMMWPSKEIRDKAMQEMRQDPKAKEIFHPMPFDASRMIFGGFDVLFEE